MGLTRETFGLFSYHEGHFGYASRLTEPAIPQALTRSAFSSIEGTRWSIRHSHFKRY